MIRISRKFTIQAAHFLPDVSDGHKCKRLHGHTYEIEVTYEGEPDERGWFADFADIDAHWAAVHDLLDHRCLNDFMRNPTTENLCEKIAVMMEWPTKAARLCRVVASENGRSSVEWAQ